MAHLSNIALAIGKLLGLGIFFISSTVWAYGWTGHARVLEQEWNTLTSNPCAGNSSNNSPNQKIKALDFSNPDIAASAVLGAIFSDIGYAQKDTEEFSDLMHYVGTGEFANTLRAITCSTPRSDSLLAFMVGFRSHSIADRFGHFEGTNVATAMLSQNIAVKGLYRAPYELDIETHKNLEMVTFTIFDLRHGSTSLLRHFIESGHDEQLIEPLISLIREALLQTYKNSAAQLVPTVPTALQIKKYMDAVRGVVCKTVSEVYEKQPDIPNIKETRASCKKSLDARSIKDWDLPAGIDWKQFIARGVYWSWNDHLRSIYEGSIQVVRDKLLESNNKDFANYNLDTNMPSVGGQYEHADNAFLQRQGQVMATAIAQCQSGDVIPKVKTALKSFQGFQEAGICVRSFAESKAFSSSCNDLLHTPEFEFIQGRWLPDLTRPIGMAGNASSCNSEKIEVFGKQLRIGKDCTIMRGIPINMMEGALACLESGGRIKKTGSSAISPLTLYPLLPPADVAERLRIGQRKRKINPADGLYH